MTLSVVPTGLALIAALVLMLAPPAVTLAGNPDWRASPRFDGQAYHLSLEDVVGQAVDPTGAAAVLATPQRWDGKEVDEAQVAAELAAEGFGGVASPWPCCWST